MAMVLKIFINRTFVSVCYQALQVNARVITTDQIEYHNSLKDNFKQMCSVLSELMEEQIISFDDQNNPHRNSLALFSAISGRSAANFPSSNVI